MAFLSLRKTVSSSRSASLRSAKNGNPRNKFGNSDRTTPAFQISGAGIVRIATAPFLCVRLVDRSFRSMNRVGVHELDGNLLRAVEDLFEHKIEVSVGR